MKKILTFALLSFSTLFAKEYMAQIKAYEMYEIKSQTSGIVEFVNKTLETSYIPNKTLLLKIDSKDESIELLGQENSLVAQKEIVKIKKENYLAKNRIKQLSQYDKNNEKLSFLEAKKELITSKKTINKLQNEIKKKIFYIENRYISLISVKKGEYVNIADNLFTMYDISKLKITLYLSNKEIANIKNQTLYIEGKKSDFVIDKISKIKDKQKVSRYKVEFIKTNTNTKNYFFDTVVKVELK